MSTVYYYNVIIGNTDDKLAIKVEKKQYALNGVIQPVYEYKDLSTGRFIIIYYTNGLTDTLYPLIKNLKLYQIIKNSKDNVLPDSINRYL
jgi:hypothetical protein